MKRKLLTTSLAIMLTTQFSCAQDYLDQSSQKSADVTGVNLALEFIKAKVVKIEEELSTEDSLGIADFLRDFAIEGSSQDKSHDKEIQTAGFYLLGDEKEEAAVSVANYRAEINDSVGSIDACTLAAIDLALEDDPRNAVDSLLRCTKRSLVYGTDYRLQTDFNSMAYNLLKTTCGDSCIAELQKELIK